MFGIIACRHCLVCGVRGHGPPDEISILTRKKQFSRLSDWEKIWSWKSWSCIFFLRFHVCVYLLWFAMYTLRSSLHVGVSLIYRGPCKNKSSVLLRSDIDLACQRSTVFFTRNKSPWKLGLVQSWLDPCVRQTGPSSQGLFFSGHARSNWALL